MALSKSEIFNNAEEYKNLLLSVNRPGIQDLVTWLEEKTDFFTAPSSSQYHNAFDGGLCQHSLNVYKALKKLIETTKELALPSKQIGDISNDTIIIISLLHDLCKVNFYQKEIKTWKDESAPQGNQWRKYYGYKCVDGFPLGHGEKSAIIALNFIKLDVIETMAIRWHMGMFDPGMCISPYTKPALMKSNNDCPLVVLLQEADYMASFLMEQDEDPRIANALI